MNREPFTAEIQKQPKDERKFIDISSIPLKTLRDCANLSDMTQRRAKVMSWAKNFSEVSKEEVTAIAPMSWFQELFCICLFAFGVPGAVVTLPMIALGIAYFTKSLLWTVVIAAIILAPLSFLPAPFVEQACYSWPAVQVLRYFSFKAIFVEQIQPNRPTIMVAPPHGVFPFGNLTTMMAFPSLMGVNLRGIAASAALRMPMFRQLLSTVGVIDCSARNVKRHLDRNACIGISTGGVAEVFETNAKSGNQVVVLKSRKGMIKLAFRTGADLVPCYLFGNTELLSLWTGGDYGHDFFRRWSRKLGFAMILFWGRFGLPIPYRIPILGVMAKPIPVPKKENPTAEEIDEMHGKLLASMEKLFEDHKDCYGWSKKKLIIE